MIELKNVQRVVFKVGTSTLTHDTGKLNFKRIEKLCEILSDIANSGKEVVLVSSAAISAGCAKLGLTKRPENIAEKQAVAAVGQSELMKVYEHYFSEFGHVVAQMLITKDELDNDQMKINAKNTLHTLLDMKCIPIINENDSMSYDEIQFGDNDTLSAYVSVLCDANALIILSDIDGLYDKDPHSYDDASLISTVDEITDEIRACAGGAGSDRGTGGLVTKIHAAEIVCKNNIPMYIINGSDLNNIYSLFEGKNIGTYFAPKKG